MIYKWLLNIALMGSMISFVYVPALIEEGYFIGGFVLLFLSIAVGLCSMVYLIDPNETED